ncbi:S-adenosyl-L-methionine-dependent methyltransferase [Podospora conica]|nr:S-adenosyl-L-methionine-dependent methyltransferase [Schizothecium conicum]
MSSDPKALYASIDAYTLSHTHPPTRPSHAVLAATTTASSAAGLPDIALSRALAKFLALFCRAAGITRVLEVGTLGGYTAIFLASENAALHVVTIEVDAHHAAVARKNVADAGLEGRVEVIEGAGTEVLGGLKGEVGRGERGRFGLVFIDADKENNWRYFDAVVGGGVVGERGVVVVDNVVRRGRVLEEGSGDKGVLGAREVIERVGADERVDSVVVQSVGEKGHDGWLWAVVN